VGDFFMSQIRKFIEWLSFHPTSDDIARALATDYLEDLGVCGVRIGRVNNDGSAMVLGMYGTAIVEEYRNKVFSNSEWREHVSPVTAILTGENKSRWAPDSKMTVVQLRDRGILQGNVVIEFVQPVEDNKKTAVLEAIEDYCVPISLYLSFQNRSAANVASINLPNDSRDAGAGQLTQRQILILRGMVEGKTNHELATEMGFSVSTIRHETMRIYQALAVSDRKEAAKKALMLSLI
jgi:DNA-binding CsgD family transcriptional regulator